jgi:hypothetical protein
VFDGDRILAAEDDDEPLMKPMPGLSTLLRSRDGLGAGQQVMLKLTLPARSRGVIAGFSRACRGVVRAATGRGLRRRARRGHPGHLRSLANLETKGVNRCNSE